jgi:hypothetical protein
MTSPLTATSAGPDLIDPVIGFRQWRLDGDQLWSPRCDVLWEDAHMTATCPLDTHPVDDVPGHSCSCGLYAYYEPCPRTASAATLDLLAGAVILWGAIELHSGGLRAEHCQMIALALPLSRGRKRTRCVTAARSLGVPTVPHKQLRAEAAQHGAAIPRSLRPLRQRPATLSPTAGLPTLSAAAQAAIRDRLAPRPQLAPTARLSPRSPRSET